MDACGRARSWKLSILCAAAAAAGVLACNGGEGFTARLMDASLESGDLSPILVETQPRDAGDSDATTDAGGPADLDAGGSEAAADAAPDSGPPACGADQFLCDGGCAPLVENCGSCGKACSAPANATPTCSAAAGSTYACGFQCTAMATLCGGTCMALSALQTDRHNCGSCKHDCGMGTCSSGQCQPWPVAAGQAGSAAPHIATNGTTVAWADVVLGDVSVATGAVTLHLGQDSSRALGRISMTGAVIACAVTIQSEPAVGEIVTTLTGSTAVNTTTTASPGMGSDPVMADPGGDLVYYLDNASSPGLDVCTIGASGACSGVSAVSGDTSLTNDLVLGANGVYLFTDYAGSQIDGWPAPAGGKALRYTATGHPYLLAADATYVYWASVSATDGRISIYRALQTGGGTIETLVSGFQGDVDHIATDGINVYFSGQNGFGGLIAYVPANNGAAGVTPKAPFILYEGDQVASVVTGNGNVFWYDTSNSMIYQLRFP